MHKRGKEGARMRDAVPDPRIAVLDDYIRAKDENRPHLIPQGFCDTACLEMHVKTDSISFPARSETRA